MSQRVARIVLSEGARRGATRKELLAAAMTGIVESHFENLPGGDADSSGWRQERARYYPNPRNITASAGRFFDAARALRGKGLSAAQLAQAVQRSAYPDRYGEVRGEARRLLGGADVTAGQGFGGRSVKIRGYDRLDPVALGRASLEAGAAGHKNPLIDLMPGLLEGKYDEHVAGSRIKIPGIPAPALAGGGTTGKGKVRVSGNANRAGVPLKPIVTNFVAVIAGVYGKPLTIGTGTNHKQMTTSGNVSDHWDGHGADIPAAGAALTRLGQDALIAAGMNPKAARKQRGGVFNLNRGGHRIQILFNTNVGGNHYNHLHVGVR